MDTHINSTTIFIVISSLITSYHHPALSSVFIRRLPLLFRRWDFHRRAELTRLLHRQQIHLMKCSDWRGLTWRSLTTVICSINVALISPIYISNSLRITFSAISAWIDLQANMMDWMLWYYMILLWSDWDWQRMIKREMENNVYELNPIELESTKDWKKT